MDIKIDDKVKQYLENKGSNALTVELEVSESCCVPASIPHVKLGQPQELLKYDTFEKEGIKVFVYKGAVVKKTLKITLHNYLLFKEIEVSGIEML